MSSKTPRVSIGMPVYNGERLVARALDSLLAQDFEDFELIISDNASEDATQEICLDYAHRDRRIRYYRNKANIGAARNFNRVFELSTGEYFKWAGHNDYWAPEFLRRCVEVLDREPSVVLCYCKEVYSDQNGKVVRTCEKFHRVDSSKPHERFRQWLWSLEISWRERTDPVYGLIRSSALRRTRLITDTLGANLVLLAELSVLGPFWYIPEVLVTRTAHPHRIVRERLMRLKPAHNGRISLPHWRFWLEYLSILYRARLKRTEKASLLIHVLWFCATREHRRLAWDIRRTAKQLLSRHRV